MYGARVAGDSVWQFGSLSTQSEINAPVTIEVAVFCYRSQGVGLGANVFKAYVDTINSNSVEIVEDPSNGVPTAGVDGRVGEFNYGPAFYQSVYTNRGASVPGSGFRISSPTDSADAGAPGGISVFQRGPIDRDTGLPNPDFETADGVLAYRFNVVANPFSIPSQQSIHVFTPLNRVAGYYVFNSFSNNTSTDIKSILQIDPVDLTVTWIPAPGAAPAFVLAGAAGLRRRKPAYSH